jgi:hypothetical protein
MFGIPVFLTCMFSTCVFSTCVFSTCMFSTCVPRLIPLLLRVLLRCRFLMRYPKRGDLVLEIGERLKSPVDRGEPEVGDLVKLTERPQNREAHLL